MPTSKYAKRLPVHQLLASQLVNILGEKLVGRIIKTEPMGSYPGGFAEVIAIHPDENAPDIVLEVKHPTYGEIGVFEYEKVTYLGDL